MFRIRRVFDDSFPVNREAVSQVQQILRDQFPQLAKMMSIKSPSSCSIHSSTSSAQLST